jgi:hypothetical protein
MLRWKNFFVFFSCIVKFHAKGTKLFRAGVRHEGNVNLRSIALRKPAKSIPQIKGHKIAVLEADSSILPVYSTFHLHTSTINSVSLMWEIHCAVK